MDKKYIKNYWKEVRRRAWASAWDKSGMKALISVFVVLFGAVALAGIPLMFGWIEYPFFRDSLFANSLTGLAQLIVSVSILVYLFFLLLSQTPPKMHKEKEDVIENQKKTIADFERQLSNKKIRIDDEREYIQKNGVDTELRFAIYNDSVFPMENWMALVEEVSYTKNGNQKPVETNFPKNTFHLSWVGEPAMGDRIKPIPPHDYAQIKIVETITKLNAFKITTTESNEIRFQKTGYYVITIKLVGTFDRGSSAIKRIQISILYKGKKGIEKVQSHMDLSEER